MRYVLYKQPEKLSKSERFYLERYTEMSPLLKKAYALKQAFCEWFALAKRESNIAVIKEGLVAFYEQVKEAKVPAFEKAIETLKNWQTEILNSFSYGYSNGFLEGINNKTKMMKRNAYGFRSFDLFRAKILLNSRYKEIGNWIG